MFEHPEAIETEQTIIASAGSYRPIWTSAEDARLKELLTTGTSIAEAARILRRPINATERRRRKIGIFRFQISRWTPALIAELERLAAERLSGAAIAQRLGFTRSAIIGKCDRAGIALLGPKGEGNRGFKLKRKQKQHIARVRSQPAFVQQDMPAAAHLGISLLDLEDFHCRAVLDEIDDNGCRLYCGHPVVYRSFCAAHAKVNYSWGRR